MSDLELLRSVQQERDHYRSETARLRTENARLQNEIDVLLTRLSDLGGVHARSTIEGDGSDGGGGSASKNSKRAASPLGEQSRDAKKARVASGGTANFAKAKVHSRNGKHTGPPVSGANAAPLNEAAATVRLQQLTSLEPAAETKVHECDTRSLTIDDVPVPAPAPAPSVNPTAVTGSPMERRSYRFYDKVPANCLTLPPQKFVSYLNAASCAPLSRTISPVVQVSRHFISQNTSSNRGGAAVLRFPTREDCRHVLISSSSAYFPISFGSPGLFMSCFQELLGVDLTSRVWTCLAWAPNLGSRDAMYMGEYRLRSVGVMSVEDYQDQKEQAKSQIASLVASSQKAKKGDKPKTKASFQDACNAAVEAFSSGEEKINIFLMEFVQYDDQFASALREKFESWKPVAGKASDAENSFDAWLACL